MPQDSALFEYRLKQAEEHIEALEKRIVELQKEAKEREQKRLIWGVSTLGAAVMLLGGIIWNYRSVIFK